jgi:uncharacterized membrane protein
MDTIRTRPRIKVEPTPTDRVVETSALVGLGFLVVATAFYWPMVPKMVPQHSDFFGKVDSWGPKWNLLAMPVIGAFAYVALTIVCRFPHTFNYPVPITEENAERQYRIALTVMRWLKMEIVWLLAYLNWQTIQIALGRAKGFDVLAMPIALAVILGTTISLIVRAYRAR